MSKLKVLHTSDWHLGKKLFRKDRLEEQSLFLSWLFETVKKESIDLLIIAGDIFDVPTPSNQAQLIYFEFVYKLSTLKNLTTIIIAGNHDSSSLLEVPKSFFAEKNCYVLTGLNGDDIYIEKDNIKLGIKAIPYFRNFELLNKISQRDQDIKKYFTEYLDHWKQKTTHKILTAHHVFGNYEMAGSEHAIHLSGLDHFPTEWIPKDYSYVALGHIHKKMVMQEDPPIIYTGSPIPMRFSEANKKFISLITLSQAKTEYAFKEVPVFRELIQVKADIENIEQLIDEKLASLSETALPAYFEVILKLTKPVSGMADQIRQTLKKSNIELLSYIPQIRSLANDEQEKQVNLSQKSIDDLFKNYYQEKYETQNVPKEIMQSFKGLIEKVKENEENNETS